MNMAFGQGASLDPWIVPRADSSQTVFPKNSPHLRLVRTTLNEVGGRIDQHGLWPS